MSVIRTGPIRTDVLVIGAGLAGLNAAYEARRMGQRVLIVSKGPEASAHVMGFSCPVGPEDSIGLMREDVSKAACGLEDDTLAGILCRESLGIPDLMNSFGQVFDLDEYGRYALIQSLGHSRARLVHHGTGTGAESMALIRDRLGSMDVPIVSGIVIDLLSEEGRIAGAVMIDPKAGSMTLIYAKAVVLTTGGVHLSAGSTYHPTQCGDGYAMAYRAGAKLIDLEFIQHEPLRLAGGSAGISTTMLSDGCRITNGCGQEFMPVSSDKISKLTKDRLSALFETEILQGRGTAGGGILVDLRKVQKSHIVEKHRAQYEKIRRAGFDLLTDCVEVRPVAHTMMGGIQTDSGCETAVKGLFAAGEAQGGLHGASRLGGNAGSEIYVFGKRAGACAAAFAQGLRTEEKCEGKQISLHPSGMVRPEEIKQEIRTVCRETLGPVRTAELLGHGIKRLENLEEKLGEMKTEDAGSVISAAEARNLWLIASLSHRAALYRQESRGAHARLDALEKSDGFNGHIAFSTEKGMEFIPKG